MEAYNDNNNHRTKAKHSTSECAMQKMHTTTTTTTELNAIYCIYCGMAGGILCSQSTLYAITNGTWQLKQHTDNKKTINGEQKPSSYI